MNSYKEFNTDWRKVASTIYKKPVDSKIFGQAEIDVTDLDDFVKKKRKEGLKITMTHIFIAVISRCLKTELPELNTYIRRGKIVPRPSIDAMVSVLQADGGMGSVKIENADTLSLEEIDKVLKKEIEKSRKGDEKGTMKKKNVLARLPWPFRNWLYKFYFTFTVNWGIKLPFFGVSPNSFGSFILTNIGSIGLDIGFPALMPSSNLTFVIVMGNVQKKPVVIDDEVVIRKMMTVTMVIDHRLADASHGGRMLRYFKRVIKEPDILL